MSETISTYREEVIRSTLHDLKETKRIVELIIAENKALKKALVPFALMYLETMDKPDETPIYQRDDAILTAGDFHRAYALVMHDITPEGK